MKQTSYDTTPTLYIIPTPIGNMEDITLRAINILKETKIIFAEDTRVARTLLTYLNIKDKTIISSHLYNEAQNQTKLISYLSQNQNIALISDRGTPVISDPGYILVKTAIENNYNVVTLPGPTALIPALVSSGLDPNKFTFYGFLNSKPSKRKKQLEDLKNHPYTIIFYEAPHRIHQTLIDINQTLGNRQIALVREISKKHEEIIRGKVQDLLQIEDLKGEIVLIVEGKKQKDNYQNISIQDHLNHYLDQNTDPKEAIKLVAKERKIPKNTVYQEYIKRR